MFPSWSHLLAHLTGFASRCSSSFSLSASSSSSPPSPSLCAQIKDFAWPLLLANCQLTNIREPSLDVPHPLHLEKPGDGHTMEVSSLCAFCASHWPSQEDCQKCLEDVVDVVGLTFTSGELTEREILFCVSSKAARKFKPTGWQLFSASYRFLRMTWNYFAFTLEGETNNRAQLAYDNKWQGTNLIGRPALYLCHPRGWCNLRVRDGKAANCHLLPALDLKATLLRAGRHKSRRQ